MKKIIYLFAVLGTLNIAVAQSGTPAKRLLQFSYCADATVEETPVCDAVGTRSEGWYLNGMLMKDFLGRPAYDHCVDKRVICDGIGSRGEGWYIEANITGEDKAMGTIECSEMCSDMAIEQCKDVQGEILYGTCYISAFAGCMSACE